MSETIESSSRSTINRVLQQQDAGFLAGVYRVLIPLTGLDLADVAGADHQHTQAALADAAADGQGELPGQQLGGGAVLAAAEAVGDEADHGLAALDGVPAGDVISVESGEKFLCHKRSFQRARAPFSAALPKADLKIPQQNDQAGNRRSNWQLSFCFYLNCIV